MTHNIESGAVSRRAFLTAGGALVVMVGASGGWHAGHADGSATKPPLTPDRLDSYITVGTDGRIVAYYGKIDGGQGLQTSIGQIVAEELDVAFDQVTVVLGDTAHTLNMGGASAASGISKGGATLRNTAAEARRLLVEMASRKLDIPEDRLGVTDGVISVTDDPAKRVSYGDLLGGRYFDAPVEWNGKIGTDLNAKGRAKPKRPGQYKIVGKFFPRKDLPGKVFGQLEMVNDVRLPGMLHARMIRPPVAGSVPVTVDETSIANIPGAKVVRIKDVLAVVAEKEWYAVRAAERLKVTWSDSKPSFPGHDRLHDHIRRARVVERKVEDEHGSVDDAFRDAARIIEAEYEFPTQSHASLGPACAVADVRADGATLWTSTQKPHYARDGVAKLVGLPVEKVRAIWMFGTGSYGRNDQGDAGADAAVLSKELGRPVRVQYTRQQGLAWDPKGTATVCRSRAGIDAAGKVIAYEHTTKGFSRVNTSTNEGRPGATLAGQWMGAPLEPAQQHSVPHSSYKFDHQRLAWETIPPLLDRASPLRTTHLRDPHGASVLFGSECFMDELAASIASDPVEFRLRYLKHPRELAVVKAAAERAGWQARVSPRSDRTQGDIVIGRGIALRRHAESFIALIAEVRIERRSGRIQPVRYVCAADIGLVVNPGTPASRHRMPAGLRHQPGNVRGSPVRREYDHKR
jgi:nicotinate dehydrogenase subunit B